MTSRLTLIAISFPFALITACGAHEVPIENQRSGDADSTTTSGLLDAERANVGDVSVNNGQALSMDQDKLGLDSNDGTIDGQANAQLLDFLSKGVALLHQIDSQSVGAFVSAIGARSYSRSGVTQCLYLKAVWQDNAKQIHTDQYIPEGQAADCAQGMTAPGGGFKLAAGAVAVAAKTSLTVPATYAGAFGAGVVGISRLGVGGCVVGVGGITSPALQVRAAGVAPICGGVSFLTTSHILHLH